MTCNHCDCRQIKQITRCVWPPVRRKNGHVFDLVEGETFSGIFEDFGCVSKIEGLGLFGFKCVRDFSNMTGRVKDTQDIKKKAEEKAIIKILNSRFDIVSK